MGEFNVHSLDDYERREQRKEQRKAHQNFAVFMVVIISLMIGLIIYLILNYYLNKGVDTRGKMTPVDLNTQEVRVLYSYVTYGTRGRRNDKFIYNPYVTMASFSDAEKYYYALQFITANDFTYTQDKNSSAQKVYNISESKIREYMVRFFGPNVTYSNNVHLNYVFPFQVSKMNVAQIVYNVQRKGFDTTFVRYLADEDKDPLNLEYITQLDSAYRLENGTLLIRENIVYVDVSLVNGYYTLNIYKDYNHQQLIDQKSNLTANQINYSVDWSQIDHSYIEYTFPLNGTVYYFYSSQIFS